MRQDVTRRATDPVGRTSWTPDALEDRARIALALCILVAGVPAVVLMWWHDAAHDPVVRWGYPPLLAFLVAYAWVLLRRVEIAGAFSRGAVVVAQMVWIGGFAVRLRSADDVAQGWASLFPNSFMGLVVFAVVGFLYWPTARATVQGMASVVGAYVVGAGALVTLDGGGAYVRDLGRYCTYLAVVVALLHVLSRTKERLADAVARASRADAAAVRLRDMAYLDELTGIANRRRLLEELGHQATLVGPDHPVSVVFFDLDHFKTVNDTHGHATGDRVLQLVARTAAGVVREGDVLARLGGEEFVIVAPGTVHQRAAQLAERLRELLREVVQVDLGVAVTASFGVTELRAGEAPAAVLARVDALMYGAKREGRDRVVTGRDDRG